MKLIELTYRGNQWKHQKIGTLSTRKDCYKIPTTERKL